jgi:hypothetical protein
VLSFRNSTRFIAAAALAVAIGILVDAHNTSNASAPNALAAGAALPQIWHANKRPSLLHPFWRVGTRGHRRSHLIRAEGGGTTRVRDWAMHRPTPQRCFV